MKRTIRFLLIVAPVVLAGCKSWIDKIVPAWCAVMALFAGGCLCIVAMASCTITTKNSGEVGLEYGTKISFFHRSAQTAPEPAVIQSDAPALIDWLVKPKEPEVSVVPVTPVPDPTPVTP